LSLPTFLLSLLASLGKALPCTVVNAAAGEHWELCCGSLQSAGLRKGEGQWSDRMCLF